jgi:hypothetical protein
MGRRDFIQYRNELNTVNAEIKKRKPEVEALEKLQKQNNDSWKEMSELDQIRLGEIDKIKFLEELTRMLPERSGSGILNIMEKRLRSADMLILPLISFLFSTNPLSSRRWNSWPP